MVAMIAAAASCEAPSHVASSGSVQPWDTVDPAFAGCAGACGARAGGASAGVVPQPGAHLGSSTYCPVSGVVFRVDDDRPFRDVGGTRLYFCCGGCASFFDSHRDAVLAARGL